MPMAFHFYSSQRSSSYFPFIQRQQSRSVTNLLLLAVAHVMCRDRAVRFRLGTVRVTQRFLVMCKNLLKLLIIPGDAACRLVILFPSTRATTPTSAHLRKKIKKNTSSSAEDVIANPPSNIIRIISQGRRLRPAKYISNSCLVIGLATKFNGM